MPDWFRAIPLVLLMACAAAIDAPAALAQRTGFASERVPLPFGPGPGFEEPLIGHSIVPVTQALVERSDGSGRVPLLDGRNEGLPYLPAGSPRPASGATSAVLGGPPQGSSERTWQFLPPWLIYHSYLAGEKEPRFGSAFLNQSGGDWIWDIALGGRVGLLRYGTPASDDPRAFQIDIEGAALPRLNLAHKEDVDAVDFRAGLPITWRRGNWAFKTGYYHLSSHVGDEFLVRHPGFQRINYVRESLLFGAVYHFSDAFRAYGEMGYAFARSGGAQPLEFQFGVEYSPLYQFSAPFAAINGHLRQEVDFGGSVNVMAGWQWRSLTTQRLLRVGLQYYNGKSMQYEFFRQSEQLIGLGLWLDF